MALPYDEAQAREGAEKLDRALAEADNPKTR